MTQDKCNEGIGIVLIAAHLFLSSIVKILSTVLNNVIKFKDMHDRVFTGFLAGFGLYVLSFQGVASP